MDRLLLCNEKLMENFQSGFRCTCYTKDGTYGIQFPDTILSNMTMMIYLGNFRGFLFYKRKLTSLFQGQRLLFSYPIYRSGDG